MSRNTDIQRKAIMEVMEQRGFNQTRLAKAAGIAESTLRNFLNNPTSDMTLSTYVALARAADVPLSVITGEESFDSVRHAKPEESDFVWVNVYGAEASAGGGCWLEDTSVVIDQKAYRKSWLRDHGNPPVNKLAEVKVSGDSMEPEFLSGDSVLVDMTQTKPSNAVYVIEQGGALYVKRLMPMPAGNVLVISTNKLYPSYDITPDVTIVGRVINMSRDL